MYLFCGICVYHLMSIMDCQMHNIDLQMKVKKKYIYMYEK